jgi:hypothetical protein
VKYHGSSKELPEEQGTKKVDSGSHGSRTGQALCSNLLQEIVALAHRDSENLVSTSPSPNTRENQRTDSPLSLKEVLALDAT